MTELRWGILGTGNIARQFAAGVAGAKRSRVVAVGSRTGDSAETFAGQFELDRAHGSYEGVLADDAVDAVYVSLPNSMHCEWTLAALEAGKHVLCEKPIASNADEAERMFETAQRLDRLLVEALMYRSHPITQQVLEQVRGGAIGRLKLVRTSFCFRLRQTHENIRFSTALAGGALMDIGCYCLDLARLVTGEEPGEAQALGQLHESGVDEYVAGVLRFDSGVLSTFACGMTVQANNTAYLCGDEGYIELPMPWKPPQQGARYIRAAMPAPRQEADSARPGPPPREEHMVDAPLPLYGLEADDFAAAVFDRVPPTVSPAESIGNMRLLDALRRQVGVPVPAQT